mmetsp:Transcript_31179/g.46299  ORF Transcript_31179/g.46299 Transcript_31179/m.46299 type:complete len:83 (+) Transcript_31179:837-1085(+)
MVLTGMRRKGQDDVTVLRLSGQGPIRIARLFHCSAMQSYFPLKKKPSVLAAMLSQHHHTPLEIKYSTDGVTHMKFWQHKCVS